MQLVRQGEVDGVPVCWSPGEGPLSAGLVFRVGSSDEDAPISGVTHLIEHLTMYGHDPLVDANASVYPLFTSFTVEGTDEEVVSTLGHVAAQLQALPLERIPAERRILHTEAGGRSRGLSSKLLSLRFGPRTFGRPAYDEWGLESLRAEQVQSWTRTFFTRDNAALWLSGPPPPGLRLSLPAGTRQPPVLPLPVEQALPCWFPSGEVGLSMIAEGSPAAATTLRLLSGRLVRRLRHRDALVYSVWVDTERIGPTQRLVDVIIDPLEENASAAARALREELTRLAADGPAPAELAAVVEAAARRRTAISAGVERAVTGAEDHLLGVRTATLAELTATEWALTPQDIRVAMRQMSATALWALPGEEDAGGLELLPKWSATVVTGRRLPAVPAYRQAGDQLIVGPSGVSVTLGEERQVTVPYDECVAALRWDDGSRMLYGEDGFQILVEPWEWRDGAKAVAAIDDAMDPERSVRVGAGDGPPAVRLELGRGQRRALLAGAALVLLAYQLGTRRRASAG